MLNASENVVPGEARDLLSSLASSTSLPPQTSLKDLSSLDRIELLSSLEHRYNVELNETQFANAKSVAEIQQLLSQPSAQRTDFGLSGLGATCSRAFISHARVLRAELARHAFARSSACCWARKSGKHERGLLRPFETTPPAAPTLA